MITVLINGHQANYIDDDSKRFTAIWRPGNLLIHKRIIKYQALFINDIPEKNRGLEIIPGKKVI